MVYVVCIVYWSLATADVVSGLLGHCLGDSLGSVTVGTQETGTRVLGVLGLFPVGVL